MLKRYDPYFCSTPAWLTYAAYRVSVGEHHRPSGYLGSHSPAASL